jgi:hypothetical protein
MPTGTGLQGAGTTPAGFGAPTQTGRGTNVVLPDMSVGGSHGSRKINPITRDYVMNDDGRIEGMNNVQQLVQLAVTNAEPELMRLDRLDAGFEKGMLAILSAAVAPLVAQGLIEVVGVSVRMNEAGGLKPGQAVTLFKWRDRTTSEERSESV